MKYVTILICAAVVGVVVFFNFGRDPIDANPVIAKASDAMQNSQDLAQGLINPSSVAKTPLSIEITEKNKITASELPNLTVEHSEDKTVVQTQEPRDISDYHQPPPLPEPEVLREMQAAENNRLYELQDRFDAEPFDENWGGDLESQFYQGLSQIDINQSSVTRAECRTSLCQFDVSHVDVEAQNSFLKSMLKRYKHQISLSEGSLFRYQDENEQFRTTYFLYREGMNQN